MSKLTFPEIISSLVRVYKKYNCKIIGGYSGHSTEKKDILFNFVIKRNTILSTSGSLSNNEFFTFYNLSFYLKPKNILIIGNSYGVSAVFLSLLFPDSNLVAIDKYRTKGIEFTNKLLSHLKGKKIALKGDSPNDVKSIVKENFSNNKVDLVLIDALHTNKAQIDDYEAILPFLSSSSVVVFHDVINCNLIDSYNFLKQKYNFNGFLLTKTCSGMAITFKSKKINQKLQDYLRYYSDNLETVVKLSKLFDKKNYNPKINKKLIKNNLNYIIPPHPQK